ncbi:MAG: hypothetical protein WCI27_00210 [Candidatus Omnitrophota bacterium]
MSCMLRVSGKNFNVDEFLLQTALHPCAVFVKGAPQYKSKPNGKKNECSGINIEMSGADFDQLEEQIRDVMMFLETNFQAIRNLVVFAGSDSKAEIDFAIAERRTCVQTDYFPPALLALPGMLGLGLRVSVYPVLINKKR